MMRGCSRTYNGKKLLSCSLSTWLRSLLEVILTDIHAIRLAPLPGGVFTDKSSKQRTAVADKTVAFTSWSSTLQLYTNDESAVLSKIGEADTRVALNCPAEGAYDELTKDTRILLNCTASMYVSCSPSNTVSSLLEATRCWLETVMGLLDITIPSLLEWLLRWYVLNVDVVWSREGLSFSPDNCHLGFLSETISGALFFDNNPILIILVTLSATLSMLMTRNVKNSL